MESAGWDRTPVSGLSEKLVGVKKTEKASQFFFFQKGLQFTCRGSAVWGYRVRSSAYFVGHGECSGLSVHEIIRHFLSLAATGSSWLLRSLDWRPPTDTKFELALSGRLSRFTKLRLFEPENPRTFGGANWFRRILGCSWLDWLWKSRS